MGIRPSENQKYIFDVAYSNTWKGGHVKSNLHTKHVHKKFIFDITWLVNPIIEYTGYAWYVKSILHNVHPV